MKTNANVNLLNIVIMTKEEENTVVKMIQYKTQRQLIGFHLTLIQIEGKQLEIWYPNYIEFH